MPMGRARGPGPLGKASLAMPPGPARGIRAFATPLPVVEG